MQGQLEFVEFKYLVIGFAIGSGVGFIVGVFVKALVSLVWGLL